MIYVSSDDARSESKFIIHPEQATYLQFGAHENRELCRGRDSSSFKEHHPQIVRHIIGPHRTRIGRGPFLMAGEIKIELY